MPAKPSPPVAGRVIVTRPQPQADDWARRLGSLGADAIALPLLRIDADAAFAPAVQQCWRTLTAGSLVMFVSPNAVVSFFAHRPVGVSWPCDVLAAATGPGTAAALQGHGVPAGLILSPSADAERFDAECLWADVLSRQAWAGRTVWVVRGETGRDWLADTLRAAGATLHLLTAYRQLPPTWNELAEQQLADVANAPMRHAWLFSSSRAVEYLADHVGGAAAWPALRAVPALATHPRIADSAREAGFNAVHAVRPDPAAVTELVHGLWGRRR